MGSGQRDQRSSQVYNRGQYFLSAKHRRTRRNVLCSQQGQLDGEEAHRSFIMEARVCVVGKPNNAFFLDGLE